MRQYTVQAGDSPARIAAEHAGCPKCARDLISVNPHKSAISYPNGYLTFAEPLRAGETLNLPDKWTSKEFDELPSAYFKALPHPDGVTPSTLGDRASGILGDFAMLDVAASRVSALASAGDDKFVADVGPAADAITQAVADAGGNAAADHAADRARAAAGSALAERASLVAAISSGESGFDARNSMLRSLSDGLVAAREALNATHSDSPPGIIPSSTIPTLQPVHALVGIDPCAAKNVAAVCAAQRAMGVSPDGKYGTDTAEVARRIVPESPGACVPRPSWWRPAGMSNCPGAASTSTPAQPSSVPVGPLASTAKKGLSAAGIVGLGLLGVGTVGGAIYLTTRPRSVRKKSRRRA